VSLKDGEVAALWGFLGAWKRCWRWSSSSKEQKSGGGGGGGGGMVGGGRTSFLQKFELNSGLLQCFRTGSCSGYFLPQFLEFRLIGL
jgi:hypothetical protein